MTCHICGNRLCTCDPCYHCRGHGADPMSDNVNWLPCPACKGSGKQATKARREYLDRLRKETTTETRQ